MTLRISRPSSRFLATTAAVGLAGALALGGAFSSPAEAAATKVTGANVLRSTDFPLPPGPQKKISACSRVSPVRQ